MKLEKAAERTAVILSLLLFGVLTGVSLFTTVYFKTTYEEIPYQKGDILPAVLLVCGLLLWLARRISRWVLREEEDQERRIRLLLLAVLMWSFCFCCYWVLAARCIPVGDQASVCKAASEFRQGDYSLLTMDSYERYLYIHPHQLGLAAAFELVFFLFGNGNHLAIQFLNCLGAVLCIYSGYRITRLLTERKAAWVFYLCLAAVCFPLFFYVTFVYGEIPSLTLCLLALWQFLEYWKKDSVLHFLAASLCAALACLVRNNSMIVVIAMLIVLLVTALGRRRLRPLLLSALLLVTVIGSREVLHATYERRAGITLNEGAPMILYVAMGMQDTAGAPGWSNGYILHAYWGVCEFDGEAAAAMGREDIRASLSKFRSDIPYASQFYWEKFTSQWNDPTCECFAMTHTNGEARGPIANSMFDGKLHYLMTWFMNQYQTLLYGGVFLWLLFGFWKKKDLETQILAITVLGGFLFSMMWEAKGRYILPYFVLLLPMAAVSLEELTARVKDWNDRRKQAKSRQ